MTDLLLLPEPKKMIVDPKLASLPARGSIALPASQASALQHTAQQLQETLVNLGKAYKIVSGETGTITLTLAPDDFEHSQGYQITIGAENVALLAATPQGLFYAVQTLCQVLNQAGDQLNQIQISDAPDYPVRGVMLDISRDKVPKMETLYDLIEMLASWKINQFQLYTEHTFAYKNHKVIWENASPMTAAEIQALDQFCQARFIELVPNQNTFGHMRPWLEHPDYTHLAEAPEGAQTPWDFFADYPFSLSPVVPESLDLVKELLAELLPNFSSNLVNVGLDETYDVGQGKSKALADEVGASRIYLDFVKKIYEVVNSHGKTMLMWGDIIMENPELAQELPKDIVVLEWGYEADHPFDKHGKLFAESGLEFYVCPGTSSWNTIAGRTRNSIDNLRSAAENGLKHGASGYLITDWGDNGHWQPYPVSFAGFAYGAACSWAFEENKDIDIPKAVGLHAFQDPSGLLGQIAYDLGDVYRASDVLIHNSSVLFHFLQWDFKELREKALSYAGLPEMIAASRQAIDQAIKKLDQVKSTRPDIDLIKQEFRWAADMMRHACRRAEWSVGLEEDAEELAQEITDLIATYDHLWQQRNRPGGYRESVNRIEKVKAQYADP